MVWFRGLAVAAAFVAASAFTHPVRRVPSVASASAPAPAPARTSVARRAVDYEATLYASGPLGGDDAARAAWCEEWARRAVLGERGGDAVKLTTPVDLVARTDGVALLYRARATGYADKDRARDADGDGDAPSAPTKSREGGVAVVAADGGIAAVRCAYDGGIVKAMSEERLVDRLRADVRAGFGAS